MSRGNAGANLVDDRAVGRLANEVPIDLPALLVRTPEAPIYGVLNQGIVAASQSIAGVA